MYLWPVKAETSRGSEIDFPKAHVPCAWARPAQSVPGPPASNSITSGDAKLAEVSAQMVAQAPPPPLSVLRTTRKRLFGFFAVHARTTNMLEK